jgi:hypothetical protein
MKNYWLEKAEAKAMTMEKKIEKMLAPHHVIWLGDDSVGRDIFTTCVITPTGPVETHIIGGQMCEWDFNVAMNVQPNYMTTDGPTTLMASNPHSDLCFDINTFNTEIFDVCQKAVDAEFARLVEEQGWNLDL